MLIWISKRDLKHLECLMSKFLDDFYAALEKVAQGGSTDPETKEAVEKIKAALTANDALDKEQSEAIMALVDKLAESTPPEDSNGDPIES